MLDTRMDTMLVATVRAVHAGQVCAPPELRRLVAKPSFSQREKEILALVATGRTNQEIAAQLFLTESTVKSHLASAFEKLGVRSRKDAAALLLDPEEGLQQTALPHAGAARRRGSPGRCATGSDPASRAPARRRTWSSLSRSGQMFCGASVGGCTLPVARRLGTPATPAGAAERHTDD